jgi:hypothetical protein
VSGIDEGGHLFVRFPLDGIDYCIGCGHPKASPEVAGRCVDADGLADDMEAQAVIEAYDWHAPDRGPSPVIEALYDGSYMGAST